MASPRAPSARKARKRWAALIKQVYETDPMACLKCGSEMKIIAFIERHQTGVIERILRHCGLWEESSFHLGLLGTSSCPDAPGGLASDPR